MSKDESAFQDLKSKIADDEASLGKKVPGAPFAVVGLTYLAILALSVSALALVFWLLS